MRKNPYYKLEYISGIPYLVSFGQGNADFYHDIRLNDTGVFLWEQLERANSIDELTALCRDYFACSPEQFPHMKKNVSQFIASLYSKGILLPEIHASKSIPLTKTLEIAGIFLRLYGPTAAFSPELLHFETDREFPDDVPHMEICILSGKPGHTANGNVLLRNDSLTVMETADNYILLFPASQSIVEIHIRKDGQDALLYCTGEFTEASAEEISYAIRILFFYYAGLQGMLAVHSASILYRDKLWLFAAPSGTGKSTHAQLWHEFLNTPIINGDLNLIHLADNQAVVSGIPWCGTSGIFSREAYPLGGIIFLEQGPDNHITTLPEDLQQLYLLHRSISPAWTNDMLECNLSIIRQISHRILLCKLTCTKDFSAVQCIKSTIDLYSDNI